METFFRSDISARDQWYVKLRDDPNLAADRITIDAMWTRFSPYADKNFQVEVTNDLISKYWEMFVGCAMLDAGFALENTGAGPDLRVYKQDVLYAYIEAVAPSGGTGPDRVDDIKGSSFWVPHDKISMRLGSVLLEKSRKHQRDIGCMALDPVAPLVIALNPRKMEMAQFRPDRAVIQLLYGGHPSGEDTYVESTSMGDSSSNSSWYMGQTIITKRSTGAQLKTGFFMDESFAGVAAVLFGCTPVGRVTDHPLTELMLLHNPFARHPLGIGHIPVSVEAWWTTNALRIETKRNS